MIEFLTAFSVFCETILVLTKLLWAIGFGASVLISSMFSGDKSKFYWNSAVFSGKLYLASLFFSGVITSSNTAASTIVGINSCYTSTNDDLWTTGFAFLLVSSISIWSASLISNCISNSYSVLKFRSAICYSSIYSAAGDNFCSCVGMIMLESAPSKSFGEVSFLSATDFR